MLPVGPTQQVSLAAPQRFSPSPCRSCEVSEKKLSPVLTSPLSASQCEKLMSWVGVGRSCSQLSAPRPEGRKRLTLRETPRARAIWYMAGISSALCRVRTVLMLVGIGVPARSLIASTALSKTPRPRTASQVSARAPSMLTWIATSPLGWLRRSTRAASIRVPLVEMQVMMPRSWQAARISSKSGRMNGSPPPKLIWNTPAWCTCSTSSSASAVVSSPWAGSPEEERQVVQRRLQASETSQVRFTGAVSPFSTYLLLT